MAAVGGGADLRLLGVGPGGSARDDEFLTAVDAACRATNSSEVNNSDTDEADGNTYADGVCGWAG